MASMGSFRQVNRWGGWYSMACLQENSMENGREGIDSAAQACTCTEPCHATSMSQTKCARKLPRSSGKTC